MLSFRDAFVGGEVESADYAGLQAAALPLGSFRRCMAAQPHLERRLSQEIEALRFHAAPAAVISRGRLVDLERMRGLAQPSR
jgi:hypothetical protein